MFTDGVNQLRQDADAFWLIDAIASYHRQEKFQVWMLKVNISKKTGVLTMRTSYKDKGEYEVTQEFEYTNFPLPEIEFYVKEGGYGTAENWTPCLVLMVPNED